MFTSAKTLRRNGVLGINRRNARYVMAYNPRKLYPLVDNKVRTKQLAINTGCRFLNCTALSLPSMMRPIYQCSWMTSIHL